MLIFLQALKHFKSTEKIIGPIFKRRGKLRVEANIWSYLFP
jgi:hypothetical protein